jgi:toxin FitB
MFLLDTTVVSDLRRRDKANRNVLAWAESRDTAEFFISVVSILELEVGTLLLARKDMVQAQIYRTWIDSVVLPEFGRRILPIDTPVAIQCAKLHVPDKRPERDALIAATALVHGMTVVTRNTEDFEPTGAKLFNPWTAKP